MNSSLPSSQGSPTLTQALVEHIRARPAVKADYEAAALYVLDAVANVVGGRLSAPGHILTQWAKTLGSIPPEAGIARDPPTATGTAKVDHPASMDPDHEAFLMGALCHILEVDDLHRRSVVHPGCVVVPAAWAMAGKTGISGTQFLRAVLEGFEAVTRVGMAVGAEHYRVWHNTATCGPYGAAMAASTVLGLPHARTVNALGNAGSQASGLWEFLETGAMTKHLHAGHAAEAGMRAARLAALGFTGPPRILEGKKGFFRAACPDADPSAVLAEPGAPWQLHLTSLKPWPCCRHTHPAIDAGREIRDTLRQAGHTLADIRSVEVQTYPAALEVCDRPSPSTDYEARFSLQHAIAAALACDNIDFAAFSVKSRETLRALAARVRLVRSESCAKAYPRAWGSRVHITVEGGAHFQASREHARGDPETPLSRQEIIDKADMLLRHGRHPDPVMLVEQILALPEEGLLPVWNTSLP